MTTRIHIELLGEFRVVDSDGQPITLSSKKARALLAYLAVRSGPASRESLATLLWGELTDERARHNLRQTVAKLRAALGDRVRSEPDAIGLDPEAYTCDVRESLELARGPDAAAWRRAIDLVRGPVLDGLVVREDGFDDWRGDLQLKVDEGLGRASTSLIAHHLDHDEIDGAIEVCQAQLNMNPTAEAVHRQRMELLARAGRRLEAVQQYGRCVESLARHVQTEPSSETRASYERIREQEATPAVTPNPGLPATRLPSVVVLPFVNASSDPQDAFFSDGIAEDVTAGLSRFGSLVVLARAAAFAQREANSDPAAVGRELGARFVVYGRVQRAGGRVRIGCELVESANGYHVWAHRFDRELADVLTVQDEVCRSIVACLAGRIEVAETRRSCALDVDELGAYECVLRGKALHHRRSAPDCREAIALFEAATQRDPQSALAHAWLACGLGQAMLFDHADRLHLLQRASTVARRALELDSEFSETHRILARIHLLAADHERASSHARRALKLNPNDDRILLGLAEVLNYGGDPDEGDYWVRRAMQQNPLHSDDHWSELGHAAVLTGRFLDALDAYAELTRPRVSDQLLQIVAEQGLGRDCRPSMVKVRTRVPTLDIRAFLAMRPYRQSEDRATIAQGLRAAGL